MATKVEPVAVPRGGAGVHTAVRQAAAPLGRVRRRSPLLGAALALCLSLVVSASVSAASPVWTKALGGGPSFVVGLAPGPDGGVFAAVHPGYYSDIRPGVRRFSAAGQQVWSRSFPKGAVVSLGDMASDASGLYLTFQEPPAFIGGEVHHALRKYRNDGSVAWTARWIGHPLFVNPDARGYPAVAVQGGTVYVFYDPVWDGARAVARFDTDDGDRAPDWPVPVPTAYPAYDWLTSDVAATSDGVYTMTQYTGPNDTPFSRRQLQVDRIQFNGSVAWTRNIHANDHLYPVSLTADAGGAIVVWHAFTAAGAERPTVRRYRVDGTTAWQHRLPAYGAAPAIGNGTTVWAVRHRYDAATSSDILVRRLSSTGDQVRESRYGSSQWESADHVVRVGPFLYLGGMQRGTTGGAIDHGLIMKVRVP